jgi:hypothetical protein
MHRPGRLVDGVRKSKAIAPATADTLVAKAQRIRRLILCA